MSMIDEAADLPSVTDSMIVEPEATCGRCGAAIFHHPAYVQIVKGITPFQVFSMPVCQACYPIAEREAEIARSLTSAAVIDDALGRVRAHVVEIEGILRGTPSPMELMLPSAANDDFALLCHAFRVVLYVATRCHVTAIVESDVAAGGTGHGDAPKQTSDQVL
jgi:hypothetical protein